MERNPELMKSKHAPYPCLMGSGVLRLAAIKALWWQRVYVSGFALGVCRSVISVAYEALARELNRLEYTQKKEQPTIVNEPRA